ncbi:MAG: flavodoxin family protein, partial [Syntrophomonas sp.]|nr:flavodoxin family protein [Syntrophomonas sp.]
GGQETTLRAIQDMMLVQGMIVVGDGFHEDDCGHMGGAGQRPANEDDNAINRSRILGKRIWEVAMATRDLRIR